LQELALACARDSCDEGVRPVRAQVDAERALGRGSDRRGQAGWWRAPAVGDAVRAQVAGEDVREPDAVRDAAAGGRRRDVTERREREGPVGGEARIDPVDEDVADRPRVAVGEAPRTIVELHDSTAPAGHRAPLRPEPEDADPVPRCVLEQFRDE
jgi:hypothetical protein